MKNEISIKGLDKAKIFMNLYNNARPQGMGFLHYDEKPMDLKEAQKIINSGCKNFDYFKGRVMKIDISGDLLFTGLYNRDNGIDSAENIIKSISN